MNINETYHAMLLREELSYQADIESLQAQIIIEQKDLDDVREELRVCLVSGMVPQSFIDHMA